MVLALIYIVSLCSASYQVALKDTPSYCARKAFKVSSIQNQKVTAMNVTTVTPSLVSTTCNEAISFCIGKYMIENFTSIEKNFLNEYLYEYDPSLNTTEILDCGCPKCELEATDLLNDIPLAGCSLYKVTKLSSSVTVPVITSSVVYTYF